MTERKIWSAFFLYTLISGFAIQLFILPIVFPQIHAGNGLLLGLDSVYFHEFASQQAALIENTGWSAWELLPKGQIVVGMASFFYALIEPEPWSLLPFIAVLHATAVFFFWKLLYFVSGKNGPALLASLPLLVFPSTLVWTAQMHNESYSILGTLLIVYGEMNIIVPNRLKPSRSFMLGILSLLVGLYITSLVRSYMVEIYFLVMVIIAITIVFLSLVNKSGKKIWLPLGYSGIALFMVFQFFIAETTNFAKPSNISEGTTDQIIFTLIDPNLKNDSYLWRDSSFIPNTIESKLLGLSLKRLQVIKAWEGAASNIDTDVTFHSVIDFVEYLPRAIQIGLLSPFPKDWGTSESTEGGSIMRRASAIEMIFIYANLVLIPIIVKEWRGNQRILILFLFSLAHIVILVFAVPNMGTLYRFRFPFIIMPIGIISAHLYSRINQFLISLDTKQKYT